MTPRSTLLLLCWLAGCADPAERAESPAVPPLLPAPAEQGPALVEIPARSDATFRPVDFGIGIVARQSDLLFSGDREADTLRFLARPQLMAPMVGALVVRREDAYGWSNWALVESGDAPNLLEFGYEEIGAPVRTLSGDSVWAEVIFAHAPDGTPRTGWAHADGTVDLVLWGALLPTYPLFFLPTSTGLHTAPDGAPLPGGLPGLEDDYILHAEAIEGDWLRVRLVTPSDYCQDPEAPAVRSGWIRYLDVAGRPTVWYYTRGC